jgi:hypothetical protein
MDAEASGQSDVEAAGGLRRPELELSQVWSRV